MEEEINNILSYHLLRRERFDFTKLTIIRIVFCYQVLAIKKGDKLTFTFHRSVWNCPSWMRASNPPSGPYLFFTLSIRKLQYLACNINF